MRKNWMALSAAALFAVAYSAAAQTGSSTADTSAAGGKTMAQTTETKHTGAGKHMKTKGKTVIGTVKELDAGKKITVTGPKNKDYSFDLNASDTTANVDPAVAVGNKVKVVEHKDAEGKTTITVSPYTGKTAMRHKKMMKKSTTETKEAPPATK